MDRTQVLLRLDPQLKSQVSEIARSQGMNVNQWILQVINEALGNPPPPDPQAGILSRLEELETRLATLESITPASTPASQPSPPKKPRGKKPAKASLKEKPPATVAPPDPQLVHPDPVVEEVLKEFRKKSEGYRDATETAAKLAHHVPTMDTTKVKELLNSYRRSKDKRTVRVEIVNALTTP
jgi:hypothetical protein